MYNDYYLQAIEENTDETNTKLSTIQTQNTNIITNQEQILHDIKSGFVLVTMGLCLLLIYNFVVRCMK